MHEDAGHYAGKHPAETGLNEGAAEAVRKRVVNERIGCKAAHEAAAEAGIDAEVIGQTLDLLEVRIMGCQLGLFGHGGKNHGKLEAGMPVNTEALLKAVSEKSDDGGIGCLSLWKAAEEAGCSRMDAAAVCDEQGINIHSCQLGAF